MARLETMRKMRFRVVSERLEMFNGNLDKTKKSLDIDQRSVLYILGKTKNEIFYEYFKKNNKDNYKEKSL